ncbi:hypothetical protein DFS34DRAFT_662310 [Phlyctochytrium arcticum]|nr:hypothetical protein DFS34DRAFT_662310 [Phlyctochytrium arcticum]
MEIPTQKNKYGFKFSQVQTTESVQNHADMSILSMELFARSRSDLVPNPNTDQICSIFYCLQSDDPVRHLTNGRKLGYHVGLMTIDDDVPLSRNGVAGTWFSAETFADEKTLVGAFVDRVRSFDPDVLTGYEIHSNSWGYLVERGKTFDIDICAEVSRVTAIDANTKFGREDDAWGFQQQSYLHCTGRIFLNVWRLMRSEMNLTSYTLENVAYHILHERIPKFGYAQLTAWYDQIPLLRWRTFKYYLLRVQLTLDILDETCVISRTSEFARVFGVDFFSILTRGSQFKVEAIMARIAKPENFIMITPSRKQVAAQRACECIPLVMEPLSRFYNSPLLVLDFQSLYPSLMIAYNYCYSTCLGRIKSMGGEQKLGILDDYRRPSRALFGLTPSPSVSPNGLAFVKPHIRQGTVSRMLAELLDTRVMIKQSMKLYKNDKHLLRILEARQLGLKFIANVTYGYTGASFSGRMPCVEIADAIVQTGRATLERAIALIDNTPDWQAAVVYGDTDSLFVNLPGSTKAHAFALGQVIVNKITSMNPRPMVLKFEKVYHPCILLAKKRYVGFKYESLEDKVPSFDAKGIETVRRDGCAAVAKTMEQCLKILFRTQDLSEVKRYLHRQWSKILSGRVSIQDFIISKEVKLGTYSARGSLPPGAVVSVRKMAKDERAEPQYGERVPFVVVYNTGPGYRLVDSVVSPQDLIANPTLQLHGIYYITKQIIPPLSRIFTLVGADVENWFLELPKLQRVLEFSPSQGPEQLQTGPAFDRTIDQFYTARHCSICHELSSDAICSDCLTKGQISAAVAVQRLHRKEKRHNELQLVCRSCTGHNSPIDGDNTCGSLDCPVYYERRKARNAVRVSTKYLRVLSKLRSQQM